MLHCCIVGIINVVLLYCWNDKCCIVVLLE